MCGFSQFRAPRERFGSAARRGLLERSSVNFLKSETPVARHNRDGAGADQRGYEYEVSYQPDWLKLVKVTRQLETGRQSTMTLFRNPTRTPEAEAGDRIRTRVQSPSQSLDFEVALTDPNSAVRRVRIAYETPGPDGGLEEVEFTSNAGRPDRRVGALSVVDYTPS